MVSKMTLVINQTVGLASILELCHLVGKFKDVHLVDNLETCNHCGAYLIDSDPWPRCRECRDSTITHD